MPKTQMITQTQIAERAFEIWEREGQPHGRDMEHWRQAEEELLETTAGSKPAPAKRAAKTAAKTAAKPASKTAAKPAAKPAAKSVAKTAKSAATGKAKSKANGAGMPA